MLEEKHNLTIQLQCTDAEAIQIIQAIKQTHPNCLPHNIDMTVRTLQINIKEKFFTFFLGYYLSLNCLPMTTAYKMCKERFAEKGIHNIPTLNQMKYKLKKIPAATIKLAREGR